MKFSLVYPGESSRFALMATLAVVFWIIIIGATLGIALLYLLLLFVVYVFAHSAFISYLRGSAVKITPEQFPDLHAQLASCCGKLEITEVPDAYLLHADGLFNALATRFLGRNYIVLFSSVVDALEEHQEALRFYIGHELGHIHRKHLKWGPVLAPMGWIPLLGAGLRRAQEYTCDRYGLFCCETVEDARAGMSALAAGHSRWKQLNFSAYRHQRFDVGGFWASFHEFTSDYPWTAKRAYAIDELALGREPKQPGRNLLAGALALLVPRIPGAGGGGFLIVIAMIGLMAAIAIPAYQDYTKRAVASGVVGMAVEAEQAVEAYARRTRQWPASLEELNLTALNFQTGNTNIALELRESGQLVYRLSGGGFTGESVDFTPTPRFDGEQIAAIEWQCSSSQLPGKLLPQVCR